MMTIKTKKEVLETYMPTINEILKRHVDDDKAYYIAVELSQLLEEEYDGFAKWAKFIIDLSNEIVKVKYGEDY